MKTVHCCHGGARPSWCSNRATQRRAMQAIRSDRPRTEHAEAMNQESLHIMLEPFVGMLLDALQIQQWFWEPQPDLILLSPGPFDSVANFQTIATGILEKDGIVVRSFVIPGACDVPCSRSDDEIS